MLVINILFGIPELSAAHLLLYRQIMTLARSYDWLKGVFLLAFGWHKYVVIRSSLDPFNWKIAHDYRVSYCNDVTVRSSTISKNLSSALLDPITINIRFRDDLTLGRVEKVTGDWPFICSPLGLVPKPGGWRRIHHLSYPRHHLVKLSYTRKMRGAQVHKI